MPSLCPEEPDGFFMFLLQMGLAQREVDVLAKRTADGIEAKLRSGGWPAKAPEGYLNKERLVSSNKYDRWVEIDLVYSVPLKQAWDLLLTDRYTLDEICEELTQQGYAFTRIVNDRSAVEIRLGIAIDTRHSSRFQAGQLEWL